jgi:hypothetical protein
MDMMGSSQDDAKVELVLDEESSAPSPSTAQTVRRGQAFSLPPLWVWAWMADMACSMFG